MHPEDNGKFGNDKMNNRWGLQGWVAAEDLVPSTSSIAMALLGGLVACEKQECDLPAESVHLIWDGPGPYWFALAYCSQCAREAREQQVEVDRAMQRREGFSRS